MSWMETKMAACAVVHDTFKRAATYFPTNDLSGVGSPVSVRVHNTPVMTGDLDREGYSQIVDNVERVVFLRAEADAFQVRRSGYVRLDDTGEVYALVLREEPRDMFSVTFQATKQGA